MRVIQRRFAAGLVALLTGGICALMLVGAGQATASSAAKTKPPAPARKSPVKFGVIYENNNAVVDSPEVEGAARAAAAYFNARGGFNGHIIEPDTCYDTATVSSAITCAQQFASDGDVFFTGQSIEDAAYVPELAQAGIPGVGNIPHSAVSETGPDEFQFQLQNADYYAASAAAMAKEKGAHVVILVVATAVAGPTVIGAEQGVEAVTGKTPSVVQVPATAPDMSPYVAAAHADGNACFLLFGQAQTQQFVTADQQSGTPCLYYSGSSGDITTTLLKSYSPASDLKWVVASPFPPATSPLPGERTMITALKAAYRAGDANANFSFVDQDTNAVWLAVNSVYQISKTVKAWTGAGVAAALNGAKNINMMGMIPPWTPSVAGPADEPRASNPYIHIIQVTKVKGFPEGYPKDVLKKPETLTQIEK